MLLSSEPHSVHWDMAKFKAHLLASDQLRRPPAGPPQWVKYHPLEREARRALGITRHLGYRLKYQLREMAKAEEAAGMEEGAMGLPKDDWRCQFETYMKGLTSLIQENRRFLQMQLDQKLEQNEQEESEELMSAVSLLTEEELRIALERRQKMS